MFLPGEKDTRWNLFHSVGFGGPLNQGSLNWECLCAEKPNQTLLDGSLTSIN